MHNSESSTPLLSSSSNTITIKSSGFRWMVLLGLSAQNTLSGILWIALAPVANHAISYYCMTAYSLNAINLIFPFTTVLVGLFTAASIDIFGVRYVLGTGILCNLTCAFLRLTSTWMTKSSSRFALLIVAQIIASIAQPFCLFAPTKLALVWFPDTQRTTATTLASLANSFGVLIGSAYPPLLVKQPSDIPSLEASIFGIAVFVALLTLPAFWRARPPNPPSVASAVFQDIAHRRRLEKGNRFFGLSVGLLSKKYMDCFEKSWIFVACVRLRYRFGIFHNGFSAFSTNAMLNGLLKRICRFMWCINDRRWYFRGLLSFHNCWQDRINIVWDQGVLCFGSPWCHRLFRDHTVPWPCYAHRLFRALVWRFWLFHLRTFSGNGC
uniref:MFS domain-containing protein n=1 Tax=Schistocephalus solidus TaxID=70667 RepID=A0A0V0JCW6_SCHSO